MAAPTAATRSATPSYHLSSTFVLVVWSWFIAATVVIHELAHRTTWDYARVARGDGIPWVYRPGTGLPSILRTIFAQAHGSITAMHLARLAVDTLEVSWASPKTWLEVFWLADRRFASPVGLATTGWMVATRWLRVSIAFWMFAGLSIIALATPIVMTRAYPEATGDVVRQVIVPEVLALDLGLLSGTAPATQLESGDWLWSKGNPPTKMFPANAYSGIDVQPSTTGGVWFITGDSNQTEMTLPGIRVTGFCQPVQLSFSDTSAFQAGCRTEFGDQLNTESFVTREVPESFNASMCSNIGPATPFGRESSAGSWVLVRLTASDPEPQEDIIRCSMIAEPGTAVVDGHSMKFANFTFTPPPYSQSPSPTNVPLDPIAALMQDDLLSLQQSIVFKAISLNVVSHADGADVQLAEPMWDGLVAMSAALFYQASRPVDNPGVQRLTTAGIRRDNDSFFAFIALLGVWFIGMFAISAALLRRTWANSLDGYASARMLQYRPDLVAKPNAQFANLEENKDMLAPFTMHHWRPRAQ